MISLSIASTGESVLVNPTSVVTIEAQGKIPDSETSRVYLSDGRHILCSGTPAELAELLFPAPEPD